MLNKPLHLPKLGFPHLWNEDNKWLLQPEVSWDRCKDYMRQCIWKCLTQGQFLIVCMFSPNDLIVKFKYSWDSHSQVVDYRLWSPTKKLWFMTRPNHHDYPVMKEQTHRTLLSSGYYTSQTMTKWNSSTVERPGWQKRCPPRQTWRLCLAQD